MKQINHGLLIPKIDQIQVSQNTDLYIFIDALHVPNLMLLYHIYFDAKKVRIHQFGIILSGYESMQHDV